MGHCCEPGGFECNYPADGCIRRGQVRDGMIDCLSDGFDESIEGFQQFLQIYPEGESHKSV